jgi:hypothetical protein
MATPLAKRAAGQSAPVPKTPAAIVLERGPRAELLDVPGLGPMWMTLPGVGFWEDLEFEMARFVRQQGLELAQVPSEALQLFKTRRILAHAARDPENHSKPFGTLEEWRDIDAGLAESAMAAFADMRERLTPLDVDISAEHRALIMAAVKKKERTILRSFGQATLVTWLLTTEFPPETSPTTRSSDGDSSPES